MSDFWVDLSTALEMTRGEDPVFLDGGLIYFFLNSKG